MSYNERMRLIKRSKQFPIYVWSYKSREHYIYAGLRSLDYLLEKLRMKEYFPVSYVGERFSDGEWGSAEFYFNHPQVKRRRNERGELQVCGTDILNLCIREPWQRNPHIEFLITGVDIWPGEEGVRFVYGITRHLVILPNDVYGYPGTVISSRRMEMYYDNPLDIFSLLAIHELGHLFGLPSGMRNDLEMSLGPHCIRADCAMSQVNVERKILLPDGRIEDRFIGADETNKFVEDRFRRTGEYFCESCLDDLEESRRVLLSKLFGVI